MELFLEVLKKDAENEAFPTKSSSEESRTSAIPEGAKFKRCQSGFL